MPKKISHRKVVSKKTSNRLDFMRQAYHVAKHERTGRRHNANALKKDIEGSNNWTGRVHTVRRNPWVKVTPKGRK